MFSLQPGAVRLSYWARHWACAVDVLELLVTESSTLGRPVAEGEVVMKAMDVMLKDSVVKLMGEQYRPGEHSTVQHGITTVHVITCSSNNNHLSKPLSHSVRWRSP